MKIVALEYPHIEKIDAVLRKLKSSKEGLAREEVDKRLGIFGQNILKDDKKISPLEIFLNQFRNFMVILLIVASLVSYIIGEVIDASVIFAIVILNAVFGYIQEFRAEKAIIALKQLTSPRARVIRNGIEQEIQASELVPGDIVLLETGNIAPADLRIIKASNCRIDESLLTGESVSVEKNERPINDKEAVISEKKNMAFSGTIVTSGDCLGIVVSTGEKTEIGRIGKLIKRVENKETILQIKLKKFGESIAGIIIGIISVIFIMGVYSGQDPFDMFLISISLAVSSIPEGLPAVVTLTLARGVQKMARNNAIVRRLPSVETLGTVDVICTDKTGTLTMNEMSVEKIWIDNSIIEVKGEGYDPIGDFTKENKIIEPKNLRNLTELLKIGSICNNAKLLKENDSWKILGDPTEGALIVSASKAKIDFEKYTRIEELHFDSSRKMMSTINEYGGKRIIYAKGAPDVLLNKCKFIMTADGKIAPFTSKKKKEIDRINHNLASQAYRVLGMAYRELKNSEREFSIEKIEQDLVFVGLQAMIDPPREEVAKSIELCKSAGIRIIVITGDQKTTALSIAKKVGIVNKDERVIEGKELEQMSIEELEKSIGEVSIFARTNPEHKVKILQALKRRGHIVAMTGDGINDAPAIKNADIGIAMNARGTDVTKEASDIILIDNNFATIVKAVEEGRHIFNSIKKFIVFLLASNMDEVLVVSIVFLFGMPIPFLPLQLLWINLVTDGLPAIALGVEKIDKNVMIRPPRKAKENILNNVIKYAFLVGFISFLCVFVIFTNYLDYSVEKARTMAFSFGVLSQLVFAFSIRLGDRLLLKENPLSNKHLVLAVISSILLQLSVIYLGFMRDIFGTTVLSLFDLGVLLFFALIPVSTIEFLKWKKIVKWNM